MPRILMRFGPSNCKSSKIFYKHFIETMSATKLFIRQNKVNVAIVLFLILFFLIHYVKPGLIYTKEGGFREFGVGYRNKTVIPIWVAAIVLAILCYFSVIFYLNT
jgi:hypothetical protein